MVTKRRIFRVLGVMFCVCISKAGFATAYDHMTLVMNGQVSGINTTVVPGSGEEMNWGAAPVSQSHHLQTSNPPDVDIPVAKQLEEDTFISPNRFALLAFVIAGFLAARKQSQS